MSIETNQNEVSRKIYLKLKYDLYIKLCEAAKKEGVGIAKFIRQSLEAKIGCNQIIEETKKET